MSRNSCRRCVAASGGEDFGSCCAGDRYGCLAYAAGRRVDQDPVARGNPGLIVQGIPGGGMRGTHCDRLMVGQAGGSLTASRASHVTNVAQQPFPEKPPTRSPTWWLLTSGPTAVTTPAKSMPSSDCCPSMLGERLVATSTSEKLTLDALTATSICPAPG